MDIVYSLLAIGTLLFAVYTLCVRLDDNNHSRENAIKNNRCIKCGGAKDIDHPWCSYCRENRATFIIYVIFWVIVFSIFIRMGML